MDSFGAHLAYPTTEVRWFQEGELPSQWLPWFEGCPGPWRDEPPRADFYLIARETDGLGVKIRQGRMEIKLRQESWGILQLNNHIRGVVEHWHKWSFEIVDIHDLPAGIDGSDLNWTKVRKLRRLRRYQLSRTGELEPLPENTYPPDLCEVELTKVWIGEQPWWTLAIEAPGSKKSSHEVLTATSHQLFSLERAPMLPAKYSFGYPHWLARLKA